MRVRGHRNRWLNSVTVELCLGPAMWHCTNGRPNYGRELGLTLRWINEWRNHCRDVALIPALLWSPWRQSCLASVEELGMTYSSTSLELRWLWWGVAISPSSQRHTKTQAQIDVEVNGKGLPPV